MSILDSTKRVVIAGVGLIGGSVGLALRARYPQVNVVGLGRSQTSLEKARSLGVVDEVTTDVAEACRRADWGIVATPVASVAPLATAMRRAMPQTGVVTDVGSTKLAICQAMDAVPDPQQLAAFIGSHPLAGDHRTGAQFARADLLDGKCVVVTPTDQTEPGQLETLADFWQGLGATVNTMSPADHDAALARVSHLPHLVASALASSTPDNVRHLASGGWRDTTRIAAADPQLWLEIFQANRAQLLLSLDQFADRLTSLREAIESDDSESLLQLLQEAKRNRDALGN